MSRSELLISLGDSRMKLVSEVLGSKSCVKILDLLGGESLTVSEISERLGMKLNTVDYNVKKLVLAGLIEKSGHWWSVKGRRMIVYRVCDRKIVISPKRKVGKKFLWVLGLTGAIGIGIRYLEVGVRGMGVGEGDSVLMKDAVFGSVPVVEMARGAAEMSNSVGVSFWAGLAGWEWFLIGAWSAVVLFFVYSLVVGRR